MNTIKKNEVLLFLLLPCFLFAQTQTVTDSALAKNFKKFGITVNLNSVGVIAGFKLPGGLAVAYIVESNALFFAQALYK